MRLSAIPQSVNVDSLEHQPRRNLHTLRPTSRGKIISQDPRLAQVLDTIDRVARSTCTVLVTGESGTGKELVVAALHDAAAPPIVTVPDVPGLSQRVRSESRQQGQANEPKLVPVIAIVVPPATGPLGGLMLVIAGG